MKGGKQPGSGRKPGSKNKIPSGRKARSIRLTNAEYTSVKEYVKQLRSENNVHNC